MSSFATIFWKKFHVPSILFRINCHDVNLQFQSPKAYLLSQQVICILPFPSPIHYSPTSLPRYSNHYHLIIIFWSLPSLLVTPQRCYSWKHLEYYVVKRKERTFIILSSYIMEWMTGIPTCASTKKKYWLQLLHSCRVLQCSLTTALINTQALFCVLNKQN